MQPTTDSDPATSYALLLLLLLCCAAAQHRYLDLHELHRVFTNAKFGRQVDYLEYLSQLSNFAPLPKHERLKAPYRCVGLMGVLSGCVHRIAWCGRLGCVEYVRQLCNFCSPAQA
jgi:hypothetical protein